MQAVPLTKELREQASKALLFRTLKPEQVDQVLATAATLEVKPEEHITRQGEPSDSFFLLLSGQASVRMERKGMEAMEIGRIQPPESLGEVGLLLGQPRTATVVAIERSVVLKFETRTFQQLFEKVPNFGLAVCRGLAHRLALLSYRAPLARWETTEPPPPETIRLLPVAFLERHRVMPLSSKGNVLTLGFVDDPTSQAMGGAQQLLPGMAIDAVRIEAALFNESMRSICGIEGWGDDGKAAKGAKKAKAVAATPAAGRSKRLDKLLERVMVEGASDLHLSAGQKPRWRIDGQVLEIEDAPVLGTSEVFDMFEPVLEDRHREEFETHHDVDFGYASPGVARARVNLFRDSKGISAAIRLIADQILSFEQLALPESLAKLCAQPKGLVLVTGPTGSGKSSTLAAMIDHINRTRQAHIITIEDPIEFIHPSQMSLVQQREVGSHTVGFARALRAALREDPNVLMVGEMRDLETISLALEAANTGMLVFGTLHTNSAITTVDRVVDIFPGNQQAQVRSSLADVLRGVVSQMLLRRSGGGRVVAVEVLVSSPAVANLIHEGKTNQLPNITQTANADGNFVLNEELQRLVNRHVVDYEEALSKAIDKKDLARRLNKPDPSLVPGAGMPPSPGAAPRRA